MRWHSLTRATDPACLALGNLVGQTGSKWWCRATWTCLILLVATIGADVASFESCAGVDLGFAGLTIGSGRLRVYWQPGRSVAPQLFAAPRPPDSHDWGFSIQQIASPNGLCVAVPLWSIAAAATCLIAGLWWRALCKRGGVWYAAKWASLALPLSLICLDLASTSWAFAWSGMHHDLGVWGGRLRVGWSERLMDNEPRGVWSVPTSRRWNVQRTADELFVGVPLGGSRSGRGDWLFIPMWPVTVLSGLPAAWLWYRARRRRGHCFACNYDLTGLALGKPCPECGKSRASTGLAPAQERF